MPAGRRSMSRARGPPCKPRCIEAAGAQRRIDPEQITGTGGCYQGSVYGPDGLLPSENEMASDPSQRKQAIAMGYIFAAAAGVLLLQWLFAAYNTIETIPYSQFEQLVNDGKVAEVGVGQDTIQGKLKENDKLPSGKQAFVTARVDPQFAEKLAQKGVVVNGVPSGRVIQTILSWVVPALLFYLF